MKIKSIRLLRAIVTLFMLIGAGVGGAFAQPDEESVARMSELIAARPNSDNLYIQRGNIYLYLKRTTEALADLAKAFSINPTSSDAFLLRGQVKIQLKDNDGAIADISQAIGSSPTGYPLAYLMRAELYEKKGDLRRAYADYVKLDELTDNPKAAQGIARLEPKLKAAGIDPAAVLAETAARPVQASANGPSLLAKVQVFTNPVRELAKEIDVLGAELKSKTDTPARLKDIYKRIGENSTKLLSARTEALNFLNREPESADKAIIKKALESDIAAVKNNLEAVAEQTYFDLANRYDANVEQADKAAAAFDSARTTDDRRIALINYDRVLREGKAIAETVIAQYLKYSNNKTIWAEIATENEKYLKHIQEMKLKYKIVF